MRMFLYFTVSSQQTLRSVFNIVPSINSTALDSDVQNMSKISPVISSVKHTNLLFFVTLVFANDLDSLSQSEHRFSEMI